jgi:hypothetical protein
LAQQFTPPLSGVLPLEMTMFFGRDWAPADWIIGSAAAPRSADRRVNFMSGLSCPPFV